MPLEEHDPVLYDLIEKEKHRQWSGLELIASENFTSKVLICHLSLVSYNNNIYYIGCYLMSWFCFNQ